MSSGFEEKMRRIWRDRYRLWAMGLGTMDLHEGGTEGNDGMVWLVG